MQAESVFYNQFPKTLWLKLIIFMSSKLWTKRLVILTPGVNFINILVAIFLPYPLDKKSQSQTVIRVSWTKIWISVNYWNILHFCNRKCVSAFTLPTWGGGPSSGVNFINILWTNFLYKRCFGSFFYIHVTREKLMKQRLYEKRARITLMKLTAGLTVSEHRPSGCNNLNPSLGRERFKRYFLLLPFLNMTHSKYIWHLTLFWPLPTPCVMFYLFFTSITVFFNKLHALKCEMNQ